MTLRRLRLRAVWLLVVPFLYFAAPTPRRLAIGGSIVLVGLLVRGWAAGVLEKNRGLTTAGPYAYTRNPLYLGSLIIGVGTALTGGHWGWLAGFLLFYLAAYPATIRREAASLAESWPEAYARYAAEVPLFVPRPFGRAGPRATRARDAEQESTDRADRPAAKSTDPPAAERARGDALEHTDRGGRAPDERFSWARYARNREWEAALGAAAAFGLLAAKITWG